MPNHVFVRCLLFCIQDSETPLLKKGVGEGVVIEIDFKCIAKLLSSSGTRAVEVGKETKCFSLLIGSWRS